MIGGPLHPDLSSITHVSTQSTPSSSGLQGIHEFVQRTFDSPPTPARPFYDLRYDGGVYVLLRREVSTDPWKTVAEIKSSNNQYVAEEILALIRKGLASGTVVHV